MEETAHYDSEYEYDGVVASTLPYLHTSTP